MSIELELEAVDMRVGLHYRVGTPKGGIHLAFDVDAQIKIGQVDNGVVVRLALIARRSER